MGTCTPAAASTAAGTNTNRPRYGNPAAVRTSAVCVQALITCMHGIEDDDDGTLAGTMLIKCHVAAPQLSALLWCQFAGSLLVQQTDRVRTGGMHAVRVESAPLDHLRRLHEGPVLVVLNHQVDEVQADLVQHHHQRQGNCKEIYFSGMSCITL